METNHFIQALPKAELHLHLEGAVPWEIVRTRVKSWPFPPPWQSLSVPLFSIN